jgi:organic hydroperoxide reductase OsmC/OhrA
MNMKKTMANIKAEPDNAVSSHSKSRKRREKDSLIKVKKSTIKAPKISKRDLKKASKNPVTTVESTVTVTSTVHAPHQESRILTATFQEQVVPATGALGLGGRPTDTRELLALAAAADHQNALQRMRQQEEMILRARMEQEMDESARAHQLIQQMRAEQEYALLAAHQRQQAERNMTVHNMAVNALMNGHSLDDILLRSGLPQEVAAEVAERMFALSQQLMAQQQGPDALTLALMQEQQNMQVANALRLRGPFP